MERLREEGNNYYITKKKQFSPRGVIPTKIIEGCIAFAYNMSFGQLGAHRNHHSGGTHRRKNGEIFRDAFQGKLSECVLYRELRKDYNINVPDFHVYQLGQWDDEDFVINNKKISVKSTKSYGNLILLETKDYDQNGIYLPNKQKENKGIYDFYLLVRIAPSCEDALKSKRLLYSDNVSSEDLKFLLFQDWTYDIPGFITKKEFQYIIREEFVLPQGSLLNGKIKMDAVLYTGRKPSCSGNFT